MVRYLLPDVRVQSSSARLIAFRYHFNERIGYRDEIPRAEPDGGGKYDVFYT